MTTSTPPTWAWDWVEPEVSSSTTRKLDGELSIHPHKPPDSDALRERNDSNPDPTYQDCWPSERYPSDGDQCSECRCAPGQPHAPDCAGVQSVRETPTKLRVGARNEHPAHDVSKTGNFPVTGNIAWICVDCGMVYGEHACGVATWHMDTCGVCGRFVEVTEARDFGNRQDDDSISTVTLPADSCCVESCPECGTVTDIEYGTVKDEAHFCQAYEPAPVPFAVQEFMFEELCEEKLAELPHIIFTHSDLIIEMARDRFRKGYAKYGSAMYSWSPERRLDETLQELADAVVYPTSGPIE